MSCLDCTEFAWIVMPLSLEVMRGYAEPISLPFISTYLVFTILSSFGWGCEVYTPMCALFLMQVDHNVDHFSSPEGEPGKPETNYNNRPHSFMVMSPCRSCQVSKQCSLLGCAIFVSHFSLVADPLSLPDN